MWSVGAGVGVWPPCSASCWALNFHPDHTFVVHISELHEHTSRLEIAYVRVDRTTAHHQSRSHDITQLCMMSRQLQLGHLSPCRGLCLLGGMEKSSSSSSSTSSRCLRCSPDDVNRSQRKDTCSQQFCSECMTAKTHGERRARMPPR